MTHLLDTDHLTFLQRQDGREWVTVLGHIEKVGQYNVGICVVSFHEPVLGLHAKLIQAKKLRRN